MRSSDPTFPLFPVFSLLGFILCTIPLTWHVQAWNAGTCAYMIWTGIQCLVEFINSLVWAGNVKNVAPVWCDISVQLLQGAGLGIPASVLCISRRLYKITSSQVASSTRRDKIRALIVDLCISVGIPILGLVMHFIVQSHRFDILEDVGCYPATYNTLPAYFLSVSWPIALGCASFVYSALNLRNFYRQRLQFAQFSSLSAMNTSRYLRLMILSMVDMMFTVPLGIFIIYSGTKGVPLQPWISWEDTHFDFGQVHFFPALLWRFKPSYRIAVELTRWSSVFCAFLFFALFGFASEAKKHYRMFFWFVVKPFGFKPAGPSAPKSPLDGWKGDLQAKPSPHVANPQRPRHLTISSTDSTAYTTAGSDDVEKGFSSPSLSALSPPLPPPAYGHRDSENAHVLPTTVFGHDNDYPSSPNSSSTLRTYDDISMPYAPLHDTPVQGKNA